MSKAIFKTLREQSAIGFDGRIVFQDINTRQQRGVLLLSSGNIVGCLHKGASGESSVYDLLVEDFSGKSKLRHIVEPELLSKESFQFKLELGELEKNFRKLYENIEKLRGLRPPGRLRLAINPDFVSRGEPVDPNEFKVLCTVSDSARVSEILENICLAEHEAISALISLRKKKALLVLS